VGSLFEWEEPNPDYKECQEEGLVPARNPGDMHEPKPYTGELDWDRDPVLHPFVD